MVGQLFWRHVLQNLGHIFSQNIKNIKSMSKLIPLNFLILVQAKSTENHEFFAVT